MAEKKVIVIPYRDDEIHLEYTICTLNDQPSPWITIHHTCVGLFGDDFFMNEKYKHLTGLEQVVALLARLRQDQIEDGKE